MNANDVFGFLFFKVKSVGLFETVVHSAMLQCVCVCVCLLVFLMFDIFNKVK